MENYENIIKVGIMLFAFSIGWFIGILIAILNSEIQRLKNSIKKKNSIKQNQLQLGKKIIL